MLNVLTARSLATVGSDGGLWVLQATEKRGGQRGGRSKAPPGLQIPDLDEQRVRAEGRVPLPQQVAGAAPRRTLAA